MNKKPVTISIDELTKHIPEHMPTRNNYFTSRIGKFFWRLSGWRCVGTLPNEKKLMVAAAPHTSNWDFIVGLPIILAVGIKASIMMKKEAFIWPFSLLWHSMGFIPIDRSADKGAVGSAVEHFERSETLWFVIAPEGTRSKTERWKTGFLSIAHQAQVPVLLVSWDFPTKTVHFGKVMRTSGDNQQDLKEIREYFSQFTGKRPENH
ncbi:1-acyl-sn-glycerol-3-phosphate acyltransferase [Pseudomonadales bacterium]|nr:1-acyl-sn-glycerol-3-phosphate acyltransferase [Pseudomonadales bacterium]